MSDPTVDVLAFGPHPDDVELHCSGTLLMLRRAGHSIAVADLTRGELSTRGTPAIRRRETQAASRLLGLTARHSLELPDGDIANTLQNRISVARTIRRLRPRTVLLPWHADRHPDHEAASVLVRAAVFQAGLAALRIVHAGRALPPWRPAHVLFYPMHEDVRPTLLVDISDVFEEKMQVIRCYASQFAVDGGAGGPETYISTPDFIEALVARWRRQGFLIGTRYAEGVIPDGAFPLPPAVLVS